MTDDSSNSKAELLKSLDEAGLEAKRIETDAMDVVRTVRLIGDAAPCMRTLFEAMPVSALSDEEWLRQSQNAKEWVGLAKSMRPMGTEISSFGAMSMACANTAVSGVMMHYTLALPSAPPPRLPLAQSNCVQTATE